MTDNNKNWIVPLLITVVCFSAVLFSIYRIIQLATPTPQIGSQSQKDKRYNQEVKAIAQASEEIDYQMLEKNYSPSFLSDTGIKSKFENNPKLHELTSDRQDKVIKSILLKWETSQIENKSLILTPMFWLWSLLIWIASIIGSKILNFFMEEYVIRKFWRSS